MSEQEEVNCSPAVTVGVNLSKGMEVDFCSSALAVRRSVLAVARCPYLLYSLSFLLLLSRFFSLFLPVRAPALSLFLSPRAPPVYDCQCMVLATRSTCAYIRL